MGIKKILSIALCFVFCAFLLSGCSNTQTTDQSGSEASNVAAGSSRMIYSFKSIIRTSGYDSDNIKTITFLDTFDNIPSDAEVWDFSSMRNNSVRAWATENGDMFIAGKGGVTATDCKNLFSGFSGLTTVNFNGCFSTVGVEDFSFMFADCGDLTTLDLSAFDTSAATNMTSMFRNCVDLASVDFSAFNTSKVTNMADMFKGCTSLTSIDLSSFDTSSVTDMTAMFHWCSGLTSIDLSAFDTSNVTSMKSMFEGCGWITSINVSSFNTASVTDFSRMFLDSKNLSDLNLSSFDFSAAKDLSHMFMWDENLTDIGCTITVPEGALNEKMYANSGLK